MEHRIIDNEHRSYKERIKDEILPYIRSLASEEDTTRAKSGVVKNLEGMLHNLALANSDVNRSTISRWLAGVGFAENFSDPNLRAALTAYFRLGENKDYRATCEELRLPLPSSERFRQWDHYLKEAD